MRVNRPTPMFGSMNFSIPCVRKISPTGNRIRNRLAGPLVGWKKNWKGLLMGHYQRGRATSRAA